MSSVQLRLKAEALLDGGRGSVGEWVSTQERWHDGLLMMMSGYRSYALRGNVMMALLRPGLEGTRERWREEIWRN